MFAKVVASETRKNDEALIISFDETLSENDATLHEDRDKLSTVQEHDRTPRSAPPGLVSKIDNALQAKIKLDSLD